MHFGKTEAGISFLDISTGEFLAAQGTIDYLGKLLQNFRPAEILFCKRNRTEFEGHFGPDFCTFALDEWVFGTDYAHDTLTRHFRTTSLKGFGVDNLKEGVIAAGCILHYLAETKHADLSAHCQPGPARRRQVRVARPLHGAQPGAGAGAAPRRRAAD
ncbi:MAG: hypothetical protein WKG07_25525 [Hymenobacter sp.]